MKNLNTLSDSILLQNTKSLVQEERKLTTSILWHLHEIERRRLYAEQGFSSLFDYCVRGLGYSEAAAGRRIAAMRLLVQVPEAEASLQTGKISLSTLCSVHHFFQKMPATVEEKRELITALEGKSRRECDRHLAVLSPEVIKIQERERVISATETEIRIVADEALMQKLKRIRELDAHVNPNPSYLELMHRLADLALKKLDPEKRTEKRSTPPAESKSENSRFIPAAIKRAVWMRDGGYCSYQSPTGQRCRSRYALEVDHVQPVALGGTNQLDNLRLLCRSHNAQQAVLKFGQGTMKHYLNR